MPLVDNRQHGRYGLRDVEIATGQATPAAADTPAATAQIDAAFAAMPDEELAALHDGVNAAMAALKRIDATMAAQAGTDAAPGLEPVSAPLGKIAKILRAQVALRSGSDAESADAGAATGGAAVARRCASGRARTPSAPWTRSRSSSGATSPRARSR